MSDRSDMFAALDGVRAVYPIVNLVDHGSYLAVFTPDDVAHIMEDGTITWESENADVF